MKRVDSEFEDDDMIRKFNTLSHGDILMNSSSFKFVSMDRKFSIKLQEKKRMEKEIADTSEEDGKLRDL